MTRQRQENMLAEWEAGEKEERKRSWKMDSDLSSATLTITPVELADGSVVYHLSDAVEIRPYPNPLSFGGAWGTGTVQSEAEAKEAEKLFLETLSTWPTMNMGYLKENGMTNIKVVWKEKETKVQNLNAMKAKSGDKQPLLLI